MDTKLKLNLKYLTGKLPLEKFIPSAFIVFLLVFIILSIITYQNINEYKESLAWIDHTQEVLKNTDAVNLHLTEMQINRRGLILKKDEKYITSYKDNKSKANYELSVLNELTKDNPTQHARILQMDSLAKMNILYIDSTITLFRSTGTVNEQQTSLIILSQNYLEELYQLATDVKSNELELLTKKRQDANSGSDNIQLFIVLTSVLAFLVIGLSLIISNRLIKNKITAEKLLKRSYEELEDKVEERTSELKLANESLVQEINNRIKTEYSLRESEERFRTMADSAPVLIWMSGRDKECNYFNKGWLDYTGRSLEEEIGSGWSEGVHPEDLQKTMETYILAFEKKEPFEMEYRLRNSVGEYRWIFDKGIPRYEGNEFAGYIGCCIDIHSRKITERYLKIQYSVSKTLTEPGSTEHILNKVLQDICRGVDWHFGVLWRTNGSTMYPVSSWSPKKKNTSNYTEKYDESYRLEKGKGLPGIVWSNAKSMWIQDLERDNIFLRKDDARDMGWKSAFAVPINNGSEVVSVIECFNESNLTPKEDLLEVLEAVGRQIGNFLEKKKAEDKLKESNAELEDRVRERTIELANTLNKLLSEIGYKEKIQNKLKLFGHAIRSIKESVYITDLENNVIFINSAFEELFGYFEEELKGKKIPVLYSEDVSGTLREEIASKTIRNGWKGELKTSGKESPSFYIYLSTSVIRNEDGKVEAIVGICQDITLTREQEEIIRKRNGLLKLLNDVITVTSKSFEFENSVSYAINKVCQYTSFDIGHCFLADSEKKLNSAGIWNYNIDRKYENFATETESCSYAEGEDITGLTFSGAGSHWIYNSQKGNEFPRLNCALDFGLRTTISVPIMKQTEAIGVLEFFKSEEYPEDREMLECITNIGIELGSLSERITILEQIKTNEKHFKAVADTANDAIITVNQSGRIIYINNTVENIFGYSSSEILNKKLELLIPGKFSTEHSSIFESVINSGDTLQSGHTLELTGKRKIGELFPLELSAAAWEINNELYFTGMIKDITLRKEIENELLEKQNSLEEAQQIAHLGNWEWDVINDRVKWSNEMYVLYDTDPGSFKATFEGFLEKLHPNDVEYVKKNIESAFLRKEPFEFYERIITPGGTIRILRSQGGVKTDDNGKVIKLFGTCLDVTEIKAAEDKIIESEKRLSLILENVKDYAIVMLDLEGNIISWNKGAEQIIGYSKEEIVGKHISRFYTPESLSKNEPLNNIRMSIQRGRYESQELRVRKDGNTFWADIIYTTLEDEDGFVQGLVKVIRDITESKKADETIRESEKQLREAQKIAKLGSWEWIVDEDIVRWSDEMYSLFEIEPGTLMTNEKYLGMLDEKSKLERQHAMDKAIKDQKPFNYYLNINTPGGKHKILNSQGEIEVDDSGKVVRMVGTVIDVTDVKEAEEKIRKSEKSLIEAQQIAKLGNWEFDILTGRQVWSDEMYRIYGFSPGEIEPDYNAVLDIVHPADIELVTSTTSRLLEKPGNTDLEYRIITKDGRLKFLNVDILVEYGTDLKPVRMYGSVQDITEIKIVEEELRKTNEKLIEAQKELVHNEKLAALGRFSSGIAHEIRNPLANISALAQLLTKTKLDEKSRKHLNYILINTDIANKIIKDLLNFASPEDLVFKEENIREIIDNLAESARPRCKESGIEIETSLQKDLRKIKIDKVKFENAMLNFISNAIDAMPSGGKLTIIAAENQIVNGISIQIIDSGTGISPENLDKILEPFFTTKEEGTGLGLGLAYQTIKSHKGTLNINSTLGKGTTVEIKLPIS